jgi:RNA polymerase sigma-70 factor (sigma-E family)
VVRREAQTGEDVLRAAFDLHYAALMRLCLALGEQPGDAEDIVQEAYVRAAPSLDQLQPGVVRAYLRRTTLNIRHDRRRRVARIRLPRGRDAPNHAGVIDQREVLWDALSRLPDRQRACLVLRYYEDLPEREVAELLGCSVGTVKSHTHRGLSRLRQEVER